MFDASIAWYDAIYARKDYRAETKRLLSLLRQHTGRTPRTLLDVACGTGVHLAALPRSIRTEGADISRAMLAVAKRRLPRTRFHRADMRTLDLGETFDAVTCLFSSIGYVRSVAELRRAVAAMARHVTPGGALVVEPWFSVGEFYVPSIHGTFVSQPELKVCRMNASRRRGRVSVMDLHYLVGTPARVRHFVERHELYMFTKTEYRAAFKAAGLRVHYDPAGLSRRGLWIGVRG